jgi:ribonuclease D
VIWVDDQQALEATVSRLSSASVVAIDTEADSLHSYFDKVCLIQISVPEEDLLIDPLAKLEVRTLEPILSDRSITKVLHGADYDLRILNRDFGLTISNLVDTMICAQLLGQQGFGLAALLDRYFGLKLDKSHQLADWSQRPLPEKMVQYAMTDTHYLIELAGRLRQELEALGRWSWAEEEFGRLEMIRWREDDSRDEAWRKIKGAARLGRRQLAALARIHAWRDGKARAADRPPFKVIGNEAMLVISENLPAGMDELRSLKGVSGYHTRVYGRELVELVRKALELPEEELPERITGKQWVRDSELERRITRLKRVRDRIASDLKIEPSLLGARHVLASIAALELSSLEDLDAVPALRQWQKSVMGPALIEAMAEGRN